MEKSSKERVIELLKEDRKLKEVAGLTGWTTTTISKWRDQARIKARPRGHALTGQSPDVQEKAKQARRMKIAGYTYAAIGQALGISRQRAQQLLRLKLPKQFAVRMCQRCGRFKRILHCHHTNYETDDFLLLCIGCHMKEHYRLRLFAMMQDVIARYPAQ